MPARLGQSACRYRRKTLFGKFVKSSGTITLHGEKLIITLRAAIAPRFCR
ncbi:hypothetical protein KCP75_11245 [Salmonella enterica subsp. enterica]|nr:hypothetical protein KCP75_11245 [Salmonella enterica subsp. enterica]